MNIFLFHESIWIHHNWPLGNAFQILTLYLCVFVLHSPTHLKPYMLTYGWDEELGKILICLIQTGPFETHTLSSVSFSSEVKILFSVSIFSSSQFLGSL